MSNFLTLNYWLNSRPGNMETKAFFVLVIFICTLAIFAFISHLIKNRKRGLYYNIWQQLNSFCFVNFIIGLFLVFFAYELIPFLSLLAKRNNLVMNNIHGTVFLRSQ